MLKLPRQGLTALAGEWNDQLESNRTHPSDGLQTSDGRHASTYGIHYLRRRQPRMQTSSHAFPLYQ